MILTRRFFKLLKLISAVIVLTGLFIATNNYLDDAVSVSVSDYTQRLQSYINLSPEIVNSNNEKPPLTAEIISEDSSNVNHMATVTSTANNNNNINSNSKLSNPKSNSGSSSSKSNIKTQEDDEATRKQKVYKFYQDIFNILKNTTIPGKSDRVYKLECQLKGDVGTRPDNYKEWYKLTSKELSNCLEVPYETAKMLQESHADYVDKIGSLVLPKVAYGGKGIVTVGGGKFSVLAFLIIRTLRNLGTSLPVEVFIPPSDEGETDFCNNVLPQYNAKCIYMTDILPKEFVDEFEFKGYQFKSLAMIASSFDDLLMLDADNFPIKDLDNIFEQEPYTSTGLVMWPDFWRRTTNPVYYSIADVPVNEKKRVRNTFDDLTPVEIYTEDISDLSDVPFHDLEGTLPDVSTESGQLMINKEKHIATVLLALYYNFNGPTWYYPIFSQKAAGEGDKETFIAAANFYGLSYYQVRTSVGVDGYHQSDDKGFRGVAMLQHDFVQDYERYERARNEIDIKYGGAKKVMKYDYNYSPDDFYKTYFDSGDDSNVNQPIKEVDIMFVHSNLPKFDPFTLWDENDLTLDGSHFRSYLKLPHLTHYDLEYENFKIFHQSLCVLKNQFKYLEDKFQGKESNRESMCNYIMDRLKYLTDTHEMALKGPISA
ncbi:hypothetical protein TBLA_0F00740 [Henningerozyma blattae CBS 6284]|uniref:Alpha-1,2-mannosyltransferase MNN2 n=1 Tax=Henningerozyma blattae (strain ATCC 34711 / CBS 6284 / DSM 70876 / NBRC 10599 / NRRL Y-10934 / UCD 77-7) TaxID=1071380 RepID=I2H5G7_HENB6|nr:hypothetical protein TBLA_0F00740 [Tetrapisispora blattae CBS 6284]CCH61619.1 hypothetical protein TBLA_0F00740 [Tetrapisispora blattae CBS 6284]